MIGTMQKTARESMIMTYTDEHINDLHSIARRLDWS